MAKPMSPAGKLARLIKALMASSIRVIVHAHPLPFSRSEATTSETKPIIMKIAPSAEPTAPSGPKRLYKKYADTLVIRPTTRNMSPPITCRAAIIVTPVGLTLGGICPLVDMQVVEGTSAVEDMLTVELGEK